MEEIYKQAVDIWGRESQMKMAIEECAEMIDAICKFNRRRVGISEVITEIADVQIMMQQMAYIFGEDAVEKERQRKLERLKSRIETYKNLTNG